MRDTVAEVDGLQVAFAAPNGWRTVLRGVDLSIKAGERVAVVGESGSGKTLLGLTMLGIQPAHARVRGRVEVDGIDPVHADRRTGASLRGGVAAMIFQDPLTSLNPVRTIGSQLTESARRHGNGSRREVSGRVVEALRRAGVPAPEERMRSYPHELSGGLRQRVMVALSIVNTPRLLIADEPTTALDATIQAQILDLLGTGIGQSALVLITHDLAVAAEVCERIVVMYAGMVVEQGPTPQVLAAPRHPYTRGLLAAVPRFEVGRHWLETITGSPPARPDLMTGCRFEPRCARAQHPCRSEEPTGVEGVACWFPYEGLPA